MRPGRCRILGVLTLLVSLASPGWAVELQEVIAAAEKPFRLETPVGQKIRDYQADFVQESHIVSLNRLQQAEGRVVVRFDPSVLEQDALARFRMEYLVPVQHQFVSDGETLWIYVPENNQVIRSDASQFSGAAQSNPTSFLTGLGNLNRDFEVTWANPRQNTDGDYRLELQPHAPSPLIAKLFLVISRDLFDKQKRSMHQGPLFPVISATIVDLNNNRSIMAFHNVVVNLDPPLNTFRLEIPRGVDIVDAEDVAPKL